MGVSMPHTQGKPAKGYVAALTGDLVGSTCSRGTPPDGDLLWRVGLLKDALRVTEKDFLPRTVSSFEIFRGDSFQGIVLPKDALRAVIVIRTFLRSRGPMEAPSSVLDARVAVGIGHVEKLPGGTVSESDGTALRRSGPALDEMKGQDRRTRFSTPWPQVDAELNTECMLLDAVIARWSKAQAEAVLIRLLLGKTQKEAGETLGVSQPAIAQRLRAANVDVLETLFARYETLIGRAIRLATSNDSL